ncbi:MAG: hypothetical protein AB1578_09120 [Thermodesulfobacteriota bacterium]
MNWKKIALGSTVVGTLMLTGLSGQALACWDCTAPRQAAATPADQAKLEEIRQKYAADLTTLEAKLRITSRDLDQALADRDSAKADDLRQKLDELEREYYGVRDRAWDEMAAAGSTGAWGRAGWNCQWHEGHDRMSRGGATASNWSRRGGCCW